MRAKLSLQDDLKDRASPREINRLENNPSHIYSKDDWLPILGVDALPSLTLKIPDFTYPPDKPYEPYLSEPVGHTALDGPIEQKYEESKRDERSAHEKAWDTRGRGKKNEERIGKFDRLKINREEFVRHLKHEGLRIASNDMAGESLFNIEYIGHSSNNDFVVNPEIPLYQVRNMMEWADKYMPDDLGYTFFFRGADEGSTGQVGGRTFKSGGDFSRGGIINVYSGGRNEAVLAHEISHLVYYSNREHADENEEEELMDHFEVFESLVEDGAGRDISGYCDEYIEAGNHRRFTEVFAAIATRDSKFGREDEDWRGEWRTGIKSTGGQENREELLEYYDKIRDYKWGV